MTDLLRALHQEPPTTPTLPSATGGAVLVESRARTGPTFSDSLSQFFWNGEYRSSTMPLYTHTITHSHNHTLLITCACFYDLTKGTQDKDFSYSFSDSLSVLLFHCSFTVLSHYFLLTALSH